MWFSGLCFWTVPVFKSTVPVGVLSCQGSLSVSAAVKMSPCSDFSSSTISLTVRPLASLPATIHGGERVAFDQLEKSVYRAFGDGERGGGDRGFANRSFTRGGEWIPLPGFGGNCLQIVPNPLRVLPGDVPGARWLRFVVLQRVE